MLISRSTTEFAAALWGQHCAAQLPAKLDELEIELAGVQSTHSKMANNYSTDKCTAAILQQFTDKQPAEAAAKVWDTLQGQLTQVLASKVRVASPARPELLVA